MKLFFCKDGVLRLGNNSSEYLLAMTDVQKYFNLPDDFEFFSRFMTTEVIVEKDSTFSTIIRCLEPWIKFWNIYSMKEISKYLSFAKQPRILTKTPYIHEVEFSHYVSSVPTNTHIFNQQSVHNSDILQILRSEHSQFLSVDVGFNFNIENIYVLRGYSDFAQDLNIDISAIPFEEWMHSKFAIRRYTNIIFNNTAHRSIAKYLDVNITNRNKHNLVFSNQMFSFGGRMLDFSTDDQNIDESYSFVEGTTIFNLEEFIRQTFNYLPDEPLTQETEYSRIFRESMEYHFSKDYGTATEVEIEIALSEMIVNNLNRYKELANDVEQLKRTHAEILQKTKEIQEETSKIVPFKASNIVQFTTKKESNDSVLSTKLQDNNIVELSKFVNNKKNVMPDSIISKTENGDVKVHVEYLIDPNTELFNDMLNYAKSVGTELSLQYDHPASLPKLNRLMGVVDPVSYQEFDTSLLKDPSFKSIEEIELDDYNSKPKNTLKESNHPVDKDSNNNLENEY